MSDTNTPYDAEPRDTSLETDRDPEAARMSDDEAVAQVERIRGERGAPDPVNEDVTEREREAILGETGDPYAMGE
jgi:hypothetical protein